MRRFYYWSVFGVAGFGYGQGIIVMWPEWSAWTWWGLATAVLGLLAVPTIWDNRASLGTSFRRLFQIRSGDGTFDQGLKEFRRDQGRGDLATRLIETAPDFQRAEKIFNDCRHDQNPRRLDLLDKAMVERLHKEGMTPETWRFLESERSQFARVNMADSMMGDEADDEREKHYQWMIMEWDETQKERRPK